MKERQTFKSLGYGFVKVCMYAWMDEPCKGSEGKTNLQIPGLWFCQGMYVCMDGWMDGWMSHVKVVEERQTFKFLGYGFVKVCMYAMDGWMDGWMNSKS